MSFPKVSIMIPTYNQQQYVVRAIESALVQDYPNIEVVIADDQSSDQTKQVVEQFLHTLQDLRVKYFRNEENIGILRNYQRTLYDRASGEWAINLDGDDFFVDRSFISKAVELAQSDVSINLVFGNYCEYFVENNAKVEIANKNLPAVMEGNDFVTRYSRGGIIWNHNSILYRRGEAIRIGCYWDDHVPRNDWESFLRLVINHRVGYVDTVVAAWVQHSSNETQRVDANKYLNNYALIEGVGAFARDSGVDRQLAERWVAAMQANSTKRSFVAYLKNRDFRGGLSFLKSASRVDPVLPLKVLCAPGVWVRALLALHPASYMRAKELARKAWRH